MNELRSDDAIPTFTAKADEAAVAGDHDEATVDVNDGHELRTQFPRHATFLHDAMALGAGR
jgi:hypothetical protein